MMITAIVAAFLLILVLTVQVRWANEFVDLYRHHDAPPSDQQVFHVGVILALRGADPFLESSLRGLMTLDHPSHEIRIIVDSPTDPAATIVERIRDELHATNVEIEFLKLCQETSSLKNSALIQGIKGCSEKCEAFAWLDSDTVPYP